MPPVSMYFTSSSIELKLEKMYSKWLMGILLGKEKVFNPILDAIRVPLTSSFLWMIAVRMFSARARVPVKWERNGSVQGMRGETRSSLLFTRAVASLLLLEGS